MIALNCGRQYQYNQYGIDEFKILEIRKKTNYYTVDFKDDIKRSLLHKDNLYKYEIKYDHNELSYIRVEAPLESYVDILRMLTYYGWDISDKDYGYSYIDGSSNIVTKIFKKRVYTDKNNTNKQGSDIVV